MKVTVQYTAQIKAAVGLAHEQVQLDDSATLSQLMSELSKRHAQSFPGLVLSAENQLLPSIVVCVQDRQIPAGEDAKLHDGDTVLFLSAISGG